MDREGFLDTVRKQYADEIHEAYLECEHEDGRTLDIPQLNKLLGKLMKNAKVEGLSGKEFEDLVKSTLPTAFKSIDLGIGKKAA